MPRYLFGCTKCGTEFEVVRPFADFEMPVTCVIDDAPCIRLITLPAFFSKGGAGADTGKGTGAVPLRHFGHSHGRGTGSHGH